MKDSLLKYAYSLVFFISFSVTSFAQIDPHPGDDDPEPGGAPFDMRLLVIIMIVGIAFAMYTINKRKTTTL